MRSMKWMLGLRGVLAVLVLTLAGFQLASGHVAIGVLLLGITALNVTMTIVRSRRRRELLERFPRLREWQAAGGNRPATRAERQARFAQLADQRRAYVHGPQH